MKSKHKIASTEPLKLELERQRKLREGTKETEKNSLEAYAEFYKQIEAIPMVSQLKDHYYKCRDKNYEYEMAFYVAKQKTFAEYFEFVLMSIERRNFQDLKMVKDLKRGMMYINIKPKELTQFLEDTYQFSKQGFKLE